MTADVDVANFALVELGAKRITSLTDGSRNANVANTVYTLVRDRALRGHNWGFATKRQQLSRLTDAPAFGYDYQFALPADWLRTVSSHDNDAGMGSVEVKEETYNSQKVLLSNSDAIYLRYIARVEDPNLWTSDFVIVFAVDLAKVMAVSIPDSNTIRQELLDDYNRIVLSAKSSDSSGSTPERRPSGSWVNSRYGWPSSRWPR
jgi:hypothetical protein